MTRNSDCSYYCLFGCSRVKLVFFTVLTRNCVRDLLGGLIGKGMAITAQTSLSVCYPAPTLTICFMKQILLVLKNSSEEMTMSVII